VHHMPGALLRATGAPRPVRIPEPEEEEEEEPPMEAAPLSSSPSLVSASDSSRSLSTVASAEATGASPPPTPTPTPRKAKHKHHKATAKRGSPKGKEAKEGKDAHPSHSHPNAHPTTAVDLGLAIEMAAREKAAKLLAGSKGDKGGEPAAHPHARASPAARAAPANPPRPAPVPAVCLAAATNGDFLSRLARAESQPSTPTSAH